MAQIIKHRGTVKNINGKHLCVQILQAAACSACEAKGLCRSSEQKEKLIDVVAEDAEEYSVGEEVILTGLLGVGLSAVMVAYVIPLILLVAVLLLSIHLSGGNEPLSALLALCALAIYYLLLRMFRFKLSKKFSFSVKHLN